MLPPDSRRTALEMIRAPVGYRLDFAVLTTYTLDLEVLLALPLSTLAHPDGGLEELLAEPLRLHQAIREAGDRVHAFVDATGIGVPHRARPLYSMLESSVHAVRAPNGGAFHPKVWVARFAATDDTEAADVRLRVVVLSRNLTFDRSWDVALTSEATHQGKRRAAASRPLGDLLSALPGLAVGDVPRSVAERVRELADQAARCAFPAPDGFDSPVAFHALGLSPRRRTWRPPASGNRTLAMAPFVNRTGLDAVRGLSSGERILVSRQDELDRLSDDALAEWHRVLVLADAAQGEPEDPEDRDDGASDGDAGSVDGASDGGADPDDDASDGDATNAPGAPDGGANFEGSPGHARPAAVWTADDRVAPAAANDPGAPDGDADPEGGPGHVRPAAVRTAGDRAAPDAANAPGARPSGLHAKMVAVEHGWDVTWYAGSANLTAAAFGGDNVEMMASVTGKKGRKGGATGQGIDRFLCGGSGKDDGFEKLCEPYRRTEPADEDPEDVTAARKRLETARDALVVADLRVTCASSDELWTLTVAGGADLPATDVEVVAWPVSVAEDQARPLEEPPRWRLPVPRLTAFIAFRLRVPVKGVDDVRMTLRLPAAGMPADRVHQILRSLLDSPEKFLAFLRALLGGLDAVLAWAQDGAGTRDAADWGIGTGGETLLDDLVRTASRDPERLKPVRRLIDDLRKTEEGRRIVPDDLFAVWTAVEEALAREPRP